jgi:hypothetical protein
MLVEWRAALLRPLSLKRALDDASESSSASVNEPLQVEDLRRRGRVLRSWARDNYTWYLIQPVGLADDLRRAGIPDEFDSITHDLCNRCEVLTSTQAIPVAG